jgi:hypothetical protein
MTAKASSLPYNAQLFKAKTKKFEETVLFVPFFEAKPKDLLRHIRLVNQLGYNAVIFELYQTPAILDFSKGLLTPLKHWKKLRKTWKLPINANMQFGLKHIYADQIESLLNLLPGKKIIYAFSNPSGAAIEAVARRHAVDVTGMICDSGPSGKFVDSFMNLAKHDWKIDSSLLRMSLAPLLSLAWSPKLHKDIGPDLDSLPGGFKILSIRGWKDLLVPPFHIDAIFERQENVAWQRLSLPAAGHLVGLRDFPEEYIPPVTKFLAEVSTPLAAPSSKTPSKSTAKARTRGPSWTPKKKVRARHEQAH